jgi:hypothetical protein
MPCLDLTELSTLQKLHFLIEATWYYHNEQCDDLFDQICKSMFKRMYISRLSVLNID